MNKLKGFLVGALLAMCFTPAQAEYLGDFAVGTDNICTIFSTFDPATGAIAAIATPAVDVYKDDSNVQDDDSGLTIDDDFDGNDTLGVCVDTSADGTFYSAGSMFTVTISVGTVGGVSIVGVPVMSFSLDKTNLAPILVDTGTTLDDFLDTEIADIRRAIGPATTTIATLASQTSFTLTAGSADDNAYNGYGIVIVDASTPTQSALGCVLDYTGASKTITLKADPGVFTMATTDIAIVLPSFCTTGVDVSATGAGTVADAVFDEDMTGHQTQGTFGQAIGDPAADANTIFKAVVTDATGATVGVDGAAILADTGTDGVLISDGTGAGQLQIASGIVDADVEQINGVTIVGDGSGTPFNVNYRRDVCGDPPDSGRRTSKREMEREMAWLYSCLERDSSARMVQVSL